jgi:AmmeMemoRadiSam system protein B
MTSSIANHYPRLRALDIRPVVYRGKPFLFLRDPLNLSDRSFMIPQALAPLLSLFDGTCDNRDMRKLLTTEFGIHMTSQNIEELIAALDEAYLLENEHTLEAKQAVLDAYRHAPFRQLILAGESYPSDTTELRQFLDNFATEYDKTHFDPAAIRGLVSPHIDFARGGSVYAETWGIASEATKEADLVVILGTDHYGPDGSISLTRQDYATPFGVLPTSTVIVDALAEALGEEQAFADEIQHIGEHSIELAAIWLHYVRDGKVCELVPILCGSFSSFIRGEDIETFEGRITPMLEALNTLTADKRSLVVAAGDLAHVGPVFGSPPLDLKGHADLHAEDKRLMKHICDGDATGFLEAILQGEDRNNVCGVPPIYLTLRALHPVRGEMVAYQHCPADQQDTSVVSVCGVVFH